MNSRQNSFSGLASKRQTSIAMAPQTAKQPKSIIEIYTDWANHYLDKLRGCNRIKDLQTELADGLVLCDVIEGVTGQKVPDIQRKPKNTSQMVDNIQACLNFLLAKGVSVQEIQAKEVREGNLKAILGLFFQLSRYKQQQKMLQQQTPGDVVYEQYGMQERGGTPRIPSVPPSPCRSIPTASGINNNMNSSPARKLATNEGLRGLTSGLPGPKVSASGSRYGAPSLSCQQNNNQTSSGNRSFLDKFKPARTTQSGIAESSSQLPTLVAQPPMYDDMPRGLGKRTSSSSGFSSARSISSKSSAASLSSDTNFHSPTAMRRIQENVTLQQQQQQQQPNSNKIPMPTTSQQQQQQQHRSPKQPQRGSNQNGGNARKMTKIPNGNNVIPTAATSGRSPCSSPKRSPKLVRAAAGATELKDYGPIDQRVSANVNYPPHAFPSNGKSKLEYPPSLLLQQQQQQHQQQQQQMLTKIPNPSRVPTVGLQKPSTPSYGQQSGIKMPKTGIPNNAENLAKEPQQRMGDVQMEEGQSSPAMQSRACSLPRQKRDEGGPTNVAVVSPMPNSASTSKIEIGNVAQKSNSVEDNDTLKNPVPRAMVPLGLCSQTSTGMTNPQHFSSQVPSATTMATLISTGPTPGDMMVGRRGSGPMEQQQNGAPFSSLNYPHHHLPNQPFSFESEVHKSDIQEDGYYSEGGSSFYARKIQTRIALEKQKTAEEQRKKLEAFENKTKMRRPLPGLPDVLAASSNKDEPAKEAEPVSQPPQTIYRVVGGRKHVQKSEASMQTEPSSQKQPVEQPYDWKKAMAHNARILSSQEKAMDEYLRRQRATAELHMTQMQGHDPVVHLGGNEGMLSLQDPYVNTPRMPLSGMLPNAASSTPATPTGTRRAHHQQLPLNGLGVDVYGNRLLQQQQQQQSTTNGGGSLERRTARIKANGIDPTAYSDSEYGKYGPGQANSPTNWKTSTPSPSHSPTPSKRDAIFGSRSLPKGTSSLNYGLMLDRIQQKRQNRTNRTNDGSLSDSNYATYGEPQSRSPYTWLHPASTYSTSVTNPDQPQPYAPGCQDIAGSNESLNSVTSSIQQARASSLTKARLMMHQRQLHLGQEMPQPQVLMSANPSEKSFGSSTAASIARAENEYYGIPYRLQPNGSRFKSQPTSPLKNMNIAEELARGHGGSATAEVNSHYAFHFVDRGSNLSLQSAVSTQDKQTDAEINKLRRELAEEHEKVLNLSSQLVTNSHVVSAFEQSLANMTARLQQLTASAERKDSELNELRRTIDRVRQAGADVGLIENGNNKLRRQVSTDSVDSCQSGDESSSTKKKSSGEGGPKRSGWLRHSFSKAFSKNVAKSKDATRSSGSLSDVEGYNDVKKSKGSQNVVEHPVRSTSAASGSIPGFSSIHGSPLKGSQSSSDLVDPKLSLEIVDDLKRKLNEKDSLLTEIRLEALSSTHQLESMRETVTRMRNELMTLKMENEKLQSIVVHRAPSSAAGNVNNDINACDEMEADRRPLSTMSDNSILSGPSSLDLSGSTDPTNKDGGKHLTVSVVLGGVAGQDQQQRVTRLGTVAVSGKSNWELLDSLVHRLFKEYLMRIDPIGNLGLCADSIEYYQVGEIRRNSHSPNPELLPYGYIFGDIVDIKIRLRRASSQHRGSGLGQPPVDELAFETLTPKSIVQRYASLLLEQKRLIISGPPSSGKSHMAQKLAQFLVDASGDQNSRGASIVTFTIQMNNVNELREFFNSRLSPSSQTANTVVPKVVILENLHQGGCLDDLFRDVLPTNVNVASPYIIGTLNPSSLSPSTPTGGSGPSPTSSSSPTTVTTNLQLHHNFRCVLFSHHMEPLRGFLGRYLRHRLLAIETRSKVQDVQMSAVVDWLARVHVHLNKIMESHSCGSDTSLGVAAFMTCPIDDVTASRNWFIRLWNESIIPHMREAIREGLQLHGQRYSWTDPAAFVLDSWPWWAPHDGQLAQLNPEEVGYDLSKPGTFSVNCAETSSHSSRPTSSTGTGSNSGEDSDPLFNMLLHLQEAANNESFGNE